MLRTRPGSRPFCRLCAGRNSDACSRQDAACERHTPQHLRLARREGTLRSLWRPVRRRNPDAADPRAGSGLCRSQGGPRLSGRAGRLSDPLCGAREPAVFRRTPDRAFRRGQRLAEARGPEPYGRAQDQQLHGPDPAGPPHGQDPHHRRNRRGPARRGLRHRQRALRPALHRLHGRGGRGAAAAQRLPHAPSGRRGVPGHRRRGDAEGRHERGDARLGHQCRRHLLHHRHGGGPAPLSGHGARLPVRDR